MQSPPKPRVTVARMAETITENDASSDGLDSMELDVWARLLIFHQKSNNADDRSKNIAQCSPKFVITGEVGIDGINRLFGHSTVSF